MKSDDLVGQQTENSLHEEIAVLAYHLWEERGRPIGSPEEDWSRAENEIREAAKEEWVRARNQAVWARDEAVRARHESEVGLPPFTGFSAPL
jgi:hypothetical protein